MPTFLIVVAGTIIDETLSMKKAEQCRQPEQSLFEMWLVEVAEAFE